jgi:rubrerythrin
MLLLVTSRFRLTGTDGLIETPWAAILSYEGPCPNTPGSGQGSAGTIQAARAKAVVDHRISRHGEPPASSPNVNSVSYSVGRRTVKKHPMHDMEFSAAAQALSALDNLGVAELEVLYRLEITAGAVYGDLADRLNDRAVAEVLRRNGREELGHAKRVRRAIAIKGGTDYVAPAYLEDRYSAALPNQVTPGMLVSMVAGERAGDDDYQRWAKSELNVEVARLLRLSGAEETKHAERLAAALGLE